MPSKKRQPRISCISSEAKQKPTERSRSRYNVKQSVEFVRILSQQEQLNFKDRLNLRQNEIKPLLDVSIDFSVAKRKPKSSVRISSKKVGVKLITEVQQVPENSPASENIIQPTIKRVSGQMKREQFINEVQQVPDNTPVRENIVHPTKRCTRSNAKGMKEQQSQQEKEIVLEARQQNDFQLKMQAMKTEKIKQSKGKIEEEIEQHQTKQNSTYKNVKGKATKENYDGIDSSQITALEVDEVDYPFYGKDDHILITELPFDKRQKVEKEQKLKIIEQQESETEDSSHNFKKIVNNCNILNISKIKKEFIEQIEEVKEVKEEQQLTKSQQKIIQQYKSILKELHESALPSQIPCRDSEKKEIAEFLNSGINNQGQSQVLYISGVPGIGKTATVLEVARHLKNFHFTHINAMNLSQPENLYSHLLEDLTGIQSTSKTQASVILNELFTKGRIPSQYDSDKANSAAALNKVLLLDECDYLITQNQQLLYNLVDWPVHAKSKLIVIMIANTMDFPERLKPKIQSRMGNYRLVFKPYNSTQIEQILHQRLKSKQIFQKDALTFLAKKVATISTDIRKTLDISRNAVELARGDYLQSKPKTQVKVSIDHVKAAYSRIYAMPYHNCLQMLHERVKLLLLCIALETTRRGYNIAYVSQVTILFNQLIQTHLGHTTQLTEHQIIHLLSQIQSLGLIELSAKNWINNKVKSENKLKNEYEKSATSSMNNISDHQISFNITVDDIKNALKDDQVFTRLQSFF